MDSLLGFGAAFDPSSLSSAATEISSSLNFRTFALAGDGFLLALPGPEDDDGEWGVGDDAALTPLALVLRLAETAAAVEEDAEEILGRFAIIFASFRSGGCCNR